MFSFSAIAQLNTIQVQDVVWSGVSVLGKQRPEFCDGKTQCNYKISPKFIGDASNPSNKSFSMKWSCSRTPEKFNEIKEPHDATDKLVSISCPEIPFVFDGTLLSKESLEQYSFRRVLLSSSAERNILPDVGGSLCLEATRAMLKDNKPLVVEAFKPLIVPFSTYDSDLTLHHRTRDSKVYQSTLNISPVLDQMNYLFSYLRTNDRSKIWQESESYAGSSQFFRRLGWRNIFTAKTSTGSSGYGPYRLSFKLSPSATILKYNPKEWEKGVKELSRRYPNFGSSCNLNFSSVRDAIAVVTFQSFVAVIAEEMGVDVIDYNQNNEWFMLVAPTEVVSVSGTID